MLAFFAALLVTAAVFAAGLALQQSRREPSNLGRRLDRLDRQRPDRREEVLALPFSERVGYPLASRVADVASAVLPGRIVSAIDIRLRRAGNPLTLPRFLTMQVTAIAVAVLIAFLAISSGTGGLMLLLMGAGGLIVALMPFYWLRARVAMRRGALLRALPDAVDLMVTTVEAGLGIDAALAEVGRETQGPLGDELRAAVRETTLGRSRREALLNIVERTQVAEIRSFILAVVQAEQTGVPIGQVLRIQADQMRIRRRQLAEAAAQRAPVKMTLVLAFFVLPALVMLIAGPAFMRMRDAI